MKISTNLLLLICITSLLAACKDDKEHNVAVTAVELNRSELTLEAGQSEILIATILPDNATNQRVTWVSSNNSVATVNENGKVKALQEGKATINVITEDGNKIASCVMTCGEVEKPAVPVTGVKLNKNELVLEEGASEQLVAEVLPANATNKTVTWVSSNETIAKVSSSGRVVAMNEGSVTITVITEDEAKNASCNVRVERSSTSSGRTVLVYLASDNSLVNFVNEDIAEMKTGMAKVKTSGAKLLIYVDYGLPDKYGNEAKLLELKNNNGEVTETIVKSYGKRNSVGVEETKEVFNDVFYNSKYKASSYGLVYWSHGDGWLPYPKVAETRWIGQDVSNGNDYRMNISELAEVLSSAPKLDFLLFDACFMQSVEVAYELRHFTDYYIGSPTEIPGPGADYQEVVPALFSLNNVAVNVAEAYYEPYRAKYAGGAGLTNYNWTAGASVSVLKSSQLENLMIATKQILKEDVNKADLRKAMDYDKRGIGTSNRVGYYDLVGVASILAADSEYNAWKQVYDASVVYWATTPKNYSMFANMFSMDGANGVSCYIPSDYNNLTDKSYRTTQWYKDVEMNKLGW